MTNEAKAAHDAMEHILKPWVLFDDVHEFYNWLDDATHEELSIILDICNSSIEGELYAVMVREHLKTYNK